MDLILCVNNDSENTINKNITDKLIININLKRDVNITTPQILLSNIQDVDFRLFNYAEIPELKRFYFINQITNINNRIWQFDMMCDVLESYKDDILKSYGRFKRNIKNGDFENISIDYSNETTAIKYESDSSGFDGETIILSVIGG